MSNQNNQNIDKNKMNIQNNQNIDKYKMSNQNNKIIENHNKIQNRKNDQVEKIENKNINPNYDDSIMSKNLRDKIKYI
jgi:hypothetical protein